MKKNQARCCAPNFAFQMDFFVAVVNFLSMVGVCLISCDCSKKKKKLLSPSFFINFCMEAPSASGTLSHEALHICVGAGSDSIPCHLSTPGERKSSEQEESASGFPGQQFSPPPKPPKISSGFPHVLKGSGMKEKEKTERQGFGLRQLIRQEEKSSFSDLDILSFPIVSEDFNRGPQIFQIAMPSLA